MNIECENETPIHALLPSPINNDSRLSEISHGTSPHSRLSRRVIKCCMFHVERLHYAAILCCGKILVRICNVKTSKRP